MDKTQKWIMSIAGVGALNWGAIALLKGFNIVDKIAGFIPFSTPSNIAKWIYIGIGITGAITLYYVYDSK